MGKITGARLYCKRHGDLVRDDIGNVFQCESCEDAAKLTAAQRRALETWFDHERGVLAKRLDGRTRKTVRALSDLGLVHYAKLSGHTFDCWQLTLAGRALVREVRP